MIAEPFADKYLSGRMGHIPASLRYGGLGSFAVSVARAAHRVYLLGAVVEGHRVGITGGLIFVFLGGVRGAKQDRRIIRIDTAAEIRSDEASPAASHPQPVAARQGVLGTGIDLVVSIQVQVHSQIDLLEVVGTLEAHRHSPGPCKRWRKYGKQKGDDCYNNEQLHKSKAEPAALLLHLFVKKILYCHFHFY